MPVPGEKVFKQRKVYVGLDPGTSGGVALIDGNGTVELTAMPGTERDLWMWIKSRCCSILVEPFAMIEQVGGHIHSNEHIPGLGHSMFRFGASYGFLRGCLTATNVPFEAVVPQKWQKAMGIVKDKGDSRSKHKNRLKAKAQQLFPNAKITLATSDALLLAEYCRRLRERELQ